MGTLSWSPQVDLRCWLPASKPSAVAMAAGIHRKWPKKIFGRAPELLHVCCSPVQQSNEIHQLEEDYELEEGVGILCEPCNGKGWLLCDFCKGQKTNVKSENNRIYRRCPNCRAVGYVLCSKCKVFKCVTFPDYEDGDLLTTT